MNKDMAARLAAIKDIPTDRLVDLARAEAAGLVRIETSAADAYHKEINHEHGA